MDAPPWLAADHPYAATVASWVFAGTILTRGLQSKILEHEKIDRYGSNKQIVIKREVQPGAASLKRLYCGPRLEHQADIGGDRGGT